MDKCYCIFTIITQHDNAYFSLKEKGVCAVVCFFNNILLFCKTDT